MAYEVMMIPSFWPFVVKVDDQLSFAEEAEEAS